MTGSRLASKCSHCFLATDVEPPATDSRARDRAPRLEVFVLNKTAQWYVVGVLSLQRIKLVLRDQALAQQHKSSDLCDLHELVMQGRKVLVFAISLERAHDVAGFARRHARAFALAKRLVACRNRLVALRSVLGVCVEGQIAELQARGLGGLDQRLEHVLFEVDHLLLQAPV